MGVVSKYGNLYDVKKNIICHAPVTSSCFRSILKKDNVLPMMNGVTTPKLFGIHAVKKLEAWTLAPSINTLIHITMAKEKATIAATLGHEYEDLEEREDFLANNADSVEKMEFVKRFNSDELMKKDLFALQSARASDIEEEIKDLREQKKAELKPIKEEISSLLKEIKQKGSMVNEKVYKFVDREEDDCLL